MFELDVGKFCFSNKVHVVHLALIVELLTISFKKNVSIELELETFVYH